MEKVQPISLWFHPGGGGVGYRWASTYEGSLVGLCRQPFCEYCNLDARDQIGTFRGGRLPVVLTPHHRSSFFEKEIFYIGHLQAVPTVPEGIEVIRESDEGLEFDQVGSNFVLYDTGQGSLLVDPGSMGFDTGDLFLRQLISDQRVMATVATHGHLDHWNAVTALRRGPIFMTYLTHYLVSRHASLERDDRFLRILRMAKMATIKEPILVQELPLRIDTLPLSHSIPETLGLVIKGSRARAVHLGDFKLNGMTPHAKAETVTLLSEIGREKVDILALNIINAHIPGFTRIEMGVIDVLTSILVGAKGRVIIACFSTNHRRILEMVKISQLMGRPVKFFGAGMLNARELLDSAIKQKEVPGEASVLFVTGCQAEESSVLWRLARGHSAFLELRPDDTLVFSSRCIPGNEESLKELISQLMPQVGQIVVNRGEVPQLGLGRGINEENVHVSGHGNWNDLDLVMRILRPSRVFAWPQTSPQIEAFTEIAKPLGIEIIPEKERIIEV